MHKRKSRGGPVGRSPRARSVVAEGVYNNALFMHAVTGHVGNVVQIKTYSGAVWEGVFRTFSSKFEVVLEVATRVDMNNSQSSLNIESVVDKMIFRSTDIVCITARDVDLDYATRDTFQTDTAISRYNGQNVRNIEERELEPWEPCGGINGDDNTSLELEPDANGWDANEMFKKNEQVYGVTSTFDHSLAGYTLQLQRKDTADYKEAEAKAAEIANEIENQSSYKAHIDLENGDEEDRFAAVHRPMNNNNDNSSMISSANIGIGNSSGKYVPPAKRINATTGKLIQNSPSSAANTIPGGGGLMGGAGSGMPPANMPPVQPMLISPKAPPPQTQQQMQAQMVAGNVYPGPTVSQQQYSAPGVAQSGPPSAIPPSRSQQSSPPKPQIITHVMNGGDRTDSKPPPPNPLQSQPPQPQRIQRSPAQAYVMTPTNQPPQNTLDSQPREQRIPRHRDEQAIQQDLRKFSQEFKLATSDQQITSPQTPQNTQLPPPPSSQQQQQQQMDQMPPKSSQQPTQSPPQNIVVPQAAPQSQQTSSDLAESVDKVANTLTKSKLNPNAKEFVYNPTPKNFTPRSPSTPSASRPHTPQTPSPYVSQATVSMAQATPGGAQPMPMVMPAYVVTSQPTYQTPPHSQSSRFRKVQLGGIRTDNLASQMQVAAATGQPLLAPAPIQQFVYQPGGLPPQPYQQVHAVRMYHESPPHAQLQYLGPPPPSNTPSPAQAPPPGAYPGSQQPGPHQPPPHQQYQTAAAAAAPPGPPQGPPPPPHHPAQFPIMCPIPIAAPPPHMMQSGMQYHLQQAPPPHTPHHIQVILPPPQPPPTGPQQ